MYKIQLITWTPLRIEASSAGEDSSFFLFFIYYIKSLYAAHSIKHFWEWKPVVLEKALLLRRCPCYSVLFFFYLPVVLEKALLLWSCSHNVVCYFLFLFFSFNSSVGEASPPVTLLPVCSAVFFIFYLPVVLEKALLLRRCPHYVHFHLCVCVCVCVCTYIDGWMDR